MSELNKKYVIQMEVLTPLHVGAGAEKDWVQGSDFVVHDGKVKILNLQKASKYININDLTTALLKKDGKTLTAKLGSNLNNCVEKVFEETYVGSNDIKTCIKNGLTNKPIVPGSSLKGAIRSIVIKHLLNGSKNLNEQTLLGTAIQGDEFFRFIKVSDAEFENTTIVNTKIFNLKSTEQGGWKHAPNSTTANFNPIGFNTYYETIKVGEKSTFSIAMATKAFDNFGAGKFTRNKQQLINDEISTLFQLINAHTKEHLRKEKAFFQKYSTEKTVNIIDNINFLMNQMPENGQSCILKMAAGSGFHSITGDWQFDDYSIDGVDTSRKISRGTLKNVKSAKSRKIAILNDNEFTLMGFVKLTTLSEEEIRKNEQIKLQQQLEIENERKAQAERIAEQERLEIEKQKELQQRIANFNEFISEANEFFQKGDYDLANISIQNAEANCPDDVSHLDLKKQIEKAIAIRLQEENALQAQQAIEQARMNANKVSLADKIAKLDKLPTIFGNVRTWMKFNNIENLEKSDLEVLANKIAELYSKMKPNEQKGWKDFRKWNDLSKVIGETDTKQIFKDLV